jgi:hypothetical protein
LPEPSREQVAVEQVAGAYPQPPFGHDVEREAGRVLVELAYQRIDLCGIELRGGQRVQRRDDPDIGRVGGVGAAEHISELSDVTRADVSTA